ncbi:MAG: hypothetical protein QT10_C0007G0091 [archaeon GW2011_AR19]|nr:MAG: hypothetical protein QT10_C0007G0091 [archaeon GW2011_AR19]
MKTEWQKFIDLLNEMFKAPVQNSRDIIILLGLYGEYIVNYLLEKKCSTGLEKINSQDIKLKILFELKEISDSEYDVLSKLNIIRNKYAHKLELSSNEVNSVINTMKDITINWDEANEEPKSLEKTMREKPFLKFQLACVTKIGYFLTKIGREKGEEINQTIIFDIKIDNKIEKFKIM